MVEYDCEKARKLLEQINILNTFINADIDVKLYKYPTSRQKKIIEPFIKAVSQVIIFEKFITFNKFVTTREISINPLLNPDNIDELQNAGTDKVNKKSHLVELAYNDKDKNLMLMQLPTKLLYSLVEASYHWTTYYSHYKEKLGMTKSTYNSVLVWLLAELSSLLGNWFNNVVKFGTHHLHYNNKVTTNSIWIFGLYFLYNL